MASFFKSFSSLLAAASIVAPIAATFKLLILAKKPEPELEIGIEDISVTIREKTIIPDVPSKEKPKPQERKDGSQSSSITNNVAGVEKNIGSKVLGNDSSGLDSIGQNNPSDKSEEDVGSSSTDQDLENPEDSANIELETKNSLQNPPQSQPIENPSTPPSTPSDPNPNIEEQKEPENTMQEEEGKEDAGVQENLDGEENGKQQKGNIVSRQLTGDLLSLAQGNALDFLKEQSSGQKEN